MMRNLLAEWEKSVGIQTSSVVWEKEDKYDVQHQQLLSESVKQKRENMFKWKISEFEHVSMLK